MAREAHRSRLDNQVLMRQFDPSEWDLLRTSFGELLESPDPGEYLAKLDNLELREQLQALWQQHQAAAEAEFLQVPLVSVRALGDVQPAFLPGQVLDRRFEILAPLGAGGMGEVYLAFDRRLSGRVAVKTIRRQLAADPAIRHRFVAEVQNARRVTHANVCRIFEIFDEGETPFLVMEYLEGPTLTEWLKHSARPAVVRRKLALELAEGLQAAHGNGIIHRDFKPDNVILTGTDENPRAVITDFGLAHPVSDSEVVPPHSLGGGTKEYMAPELAAQAPASVASDVYAFGVVLNQLLPGSRFGAECRAASPEQRPKSLDRLIRELRGDSTRRWWILASLAAPLAAGAGYRWMSRPSLAFASRQRLLLNGFAPAADHLATTLRELLITGLRQSPLVTIVSKERVRALTGGTGLLDRARLLAIARDARIPFVLEGSLERLGSKLHLLIAVLDCISGQEALRFSESGDGNGLVALADRANLKLRRDFGESENSLRATYKSLAEVTSASPEAVEAYFQGQRLFESSDADGAVTWFDRALEIDPSFALAHLCRGLALFANDREAVALEAFERAYQLRSRVSERERLWIESQYQHLCAEDLPSAVQTFRRLVRLYPEEPTFQRQLALVWGRMGRPQDGIDPARKAVELDPLSVGNRNVLIYNLAQAGRSGESRDAYQQSQTDQVTSPLLATGVGLSYIMEGDYDGALAAYRRVTAPPELERETRQLASGALVMQGRFAEAAQELESELVSDSISGADNHLENARNWLAYVDWLMDRPADARLRAAQTAQIQPLPIYLPYFGSAAGIAFELRDAAILSQVRDRTAALAARWPNACTNGTHALCEALFYWSLGDGRAAECFNLARGFWPDPLALYWEARWQSYRQNFAGALAGFTAVESAQGTLYRTYFPGLAVLNWLEQARCQRKMSLFGESSRSYKRVLNHWQQHAGATAMVRQVRGEYSKLLQGEK